MASAAGAGLAENPSIQYAIRPINDRVAALRRSLESGARSLRRDDRTGFLRPLLDALGVPVASQLLVFSKTGVQRGYTSPHTPRALYFDDSVVVAYVPDAPVIEIAAHDPQQGVIFYTMDQGSTAPMPARQTSCLTCHVSASTLNVPGYIARSHIVGDDGNVIAGLASNDVDHRTPHPDRWGGWYVTSDPLAASAYGQRAHEGNITFTRNGNTSNQVFVDWLNSSPETRGYPSPLSDIVSLLVFDHQMHAINLLTRLNWQARIAASATRTPAEDPDIRALVNELADYLLFAGEVGPAVPLVPRPEFAESLASRTPKDHLGRSFGQLDTDNRLLRYPCSYMVYSRAFEALTPEVRQAVFRRMLADLAGDGAKSLRLSAGQRDAIVQILRETKPDFPAS